MKKFTLLYLQFLKTRVRIMKFYSLIFLLSILIGGCKSDFNKGENMPLSKTNRKEVAKVNSSDKILLKDSTKIKNNWEAILKNNYEGINLTNFKIIRAITDDPQKELYHKIVAQDNSKGIKVARWLKKENGFFFYKEDTDQITNDGNQALDYLVTCKSCSESPCGPVLIRVDEHYYWICVFEKEGRKNCLDCIKSVSI